jgi:hypothetical protein
LGEGPARVDGYCDAGPRRVTVCGGDGPREGAVGGSRSALPRLRPRRCDHPAVTDKLTSRQPNQPPRPPRSRSA